MASASRSPWQANKCDQDDLAVTSEAEQAAERSLGKELWAATLRAMPLPSSLTPVRLGCSANNASLQTLTDSPPDALCLFCDCRLVSKAWLERSPDCFPWRFLGGSIGSNPKLPFTLEAPPPTLSRLSWCCQETDMLTTCGCRGKLFHVVPRLFGREFKTK